MNSRFKTRDIATATVKSRRSINDGVRLRGRFEFVCRDRNGNVKWTDDVRNLVVNEGLDELLDKGIGPTNTRFVGLKGAGAVAPGDTLGSSAWSEIQTYTETTRPGWNHAGVASQQATNVANPASYSINGPATVAGAFLASDSTKGGVGGILLCAVDFSNGTKNVDNGDTLDVVYTLTAADDGA